MSARDYIEKIEKASEFISGFLSKYKLKRPKVALVLGTGLGRITSSIETIFSIPYGDIPNFPTSTVESHRGELILARYEDKEFFVLSGRVHYYEGYDLKDVTMPIRILKLCGVENMVITNASGGLNPLFEVGDVMVIVDHINVCGQNPLRGENLDIFGPRFPHLAEPYKRDFIKLAEDVAMERKIPLKKGVYAWVCGPSLETAAETRWLRMMGADAVGMSTVPEVIVAVHSGISVLGLSIISNINLADNYRAHTIEEIIENVERAAPKLEKIVLGVLKHM